jgi:hypothetical protein
MDGKTIEAIARRAGLQKTLEAFPDDVAAAAASAEKATERVRTSSGTPPASLEPSIEPWPPMVVRK